MLDIEIELPEISEQGKSNFNDLTVSMARGLVTVVSILYIREATYFYGRLVV